MGVELRCGMLWSFRQRNAPAMMQSAVTAYDASAVSMLENETRERMYSPLQQGGLNRGNTYVSSSSPTQPHCLDLPVSPSLIGQPCPDQPCYRPMIVKSPSPGACLVPERSHTNSRRCGTTPDQHVGMLMSIGSESVHHPACSASPVPAASCVAASTGS